MDDTNEATKFGLTYQGKQRTAGMRFSFTDGVAIATCVIATIALWATLNEFALLLPYVLGHFFLFCNVFRIRRKPELIWACTFVLNMTICLAVIQTEFTVPLFNQLPVTFVLILRSIRQPSYHGVFARQWNRRHLDAYLRGEQI